MAMEIADSHIIREDDRVDASAMKSQNLDELYSIIDDGYTSDGDLDTRKLVNEMNRKKKKSGGFQSMGLTRAVFYGVMKRGYKVPTPIQRKCIPLVLQGKDVVAMARTGSGKTAAFLIPLLEKLQARQSMTGARALLLSPTRELAMQTRKFVKELGRFTNLKIACVLGGDKMDDQFAALHENPDIIIATPGRLMHVLVEMELKLKVVEYVVFDEADRLFELGFQEQLHEILRRLPEDRQTLLFSATLPGQLVEFAKAGLNDPTLIRLDVDSKLSDQLKLAFLHVRDEDKLPALMHLLRCVCKEEEQTVVFVATKHHVEYLYEILLHCGLKCSYVYSSLDQTARKINIAKFRNKLTKVLIVTDVAARGLDIPMLDNVINFSFPSKSKLFVHRVGRVARAGRTGAAYSLVSSDELPYVIDLHLFLGRPLNFVKSDATYKAWDDLYGQVSQVVIDEEYATLQTFVDKPDIAALAKVSHNAYKQYLRSRPVASSESIKRSKETLLTTDIGVHPLYETCLDSAEKARLQLLTSMKNYKPSSTIFEIGATAKSASAMVMKKTRKRNAKFVARFKENLLKKQEEADQRLESSCKEGFTSANNVEESEITSAFHTVRRSSTKKQKFPSKTKNRKEKLDFKDKEFYIEYQPKDHHSEAGLSVSMSQNFTKEASSVALDLMGDEDVQLRKYKMQRKVWDNKRKRYVNLQDYDKSLAKKKIRTESGAVISASYKKNLYEEWKKKSKPDDQENEHTADGVTRTWRTTSRQKLGTKPDKKRIRSELRKPEQILKARKVKEERIQRQQKRAGKFVGKRSAGQSKRKKRRR